MGIAIIAITRNGAKLAEKLFESLPGAVLHISSRCSSSHHISAMFPPEELRQVIENAWRQGQSIVCIMATGIVVRMIAPLLDSKEHDPAVVVMDEAGRFSISLVSGHLGGANELAEQCAFITGARAVISTATDVNSLPSFDLLAKAHGWVIDRIGGVKRLNALLLEGRPIAVVDPSGNTRSFFHGRGELKFYDTFVEAMHSGAAGHLFVSNRFLPPNMHHENLLLLRPRNLVLGIGCNRGTPASEIEDFVQMNLKRIFLSMKSIACVATAEAKKDEKGLLDFAESYSVPLRFFSSGELNSVIHPSPKSDYAMAAIGAVGVAEPAAILASGGGTLLLKKVKNENVTLAVAELI